MSGLFLPLPDTIPRWCCHAGVGGGIFAKLVLLWASLLQWDVEADHQQVVSWVELVASFEISMGTRIPQRKGVRIKGPAEKVLSWNPLDANFGRDTPWGMKADEFRTACGQLGRLLNADLLKGERTTINLGTLHGYPGYRIPVSAMNRRPRFPCQERACMHLHRALASTATRIGPHSWRPEWPLEPLEDAKPLLQQIVQVQ